MLPLSGTLVNWKGEGETPDPTKLIVVYYSSVSGNMTVRLFSPPHLTLLR